MKKLVFIAILSLIGTLAFSQAQFSVTVSSDSILMGNHFVVTFSLENAQTNSFSPPTFEGFDIIGGPNQSSSFSMINGVTSQSQSYAYYLLPKEEGLFYIPPANVEVDGAVLETEPVEIKVFPNPEGIIQKPQRPSRRDFFSNPIEPQPKKPKKKRRIYRM